MNPAEVTKLPAANEIDAATATATAGGDACSPDSIVALSQSLIEVYDNLVDFTSHVIERVAGSD
jgi:hypothetical protein